MITKFSEKQKGVVALVLLAFIFASMGWFARFLNTEFSILQQVYLRIMAAFVLGIPIFYSDLHFEKLKKIPPKEWLILLLRSIALYVFGVTLFSRALILAKFSNVSFIGALPITAILGFILLHEKITLPKVIYLLLTFVGVILISVKDYGHLTSWGSGEILALISGFFFSFSYVARKWQSNFLNNKEMTLLIFGISSILLFVTSLGMGEQLSSPSSWSVTIIVAIVAAGLLNVFNLFLTNYGFQKVEAVLASNLLTLESVFAIILGFTFYNELPNLSELLGGVLIIWCVYQMNKLS